MDYSKIRARAVAGIKFFSDSDGENAYKLVTTGGGVQIGPDGKEVVVPEESTLLTGLVRAVSVRDINGESILAGDKRGIFGPEVEIKMGMVIYVDGDAYSVVDPRPIKPTKTVVAYRPILRRVAGA